MRQFSKYAIGIALISTLIVLIAYIRNFYGRFSIANSDWGTFGDYVGGTLNPILGILTVVLTYDIISNQHTENKQSEFKYMFQILFDVMDQNKNLITVQRFGESVTGRDALKIINKNIENLYLSISNGDEDKNLANFEKAFWSVYKDINASSSTYMKNMHSILKVIDDHCNENRKGTYSDLVRAQLHTEELKFILYNGISSGNFKKFKGRLEKYHILKDLYDNDSISPNLKSAYSQNAYQDKI